jgi:hypothetical protein
LRLKPPDFGSRSAQNAFEHRGGTEWRLHRGTSLEHSEKSWIDGGTKSLPACSQLHGPQVAGRVLDDARFGTEHSLQTDVAPVVALPDFCRSSTGLNAFDAIGAAQQIPVVLQCER